MLRLNQIFINILSNAVKYTPSGGSIQVLLREEALDEENRLRLIYRVQDTGIGMSQEYIKTLYEPFTREKDGRIDKIEGSGLGMAIAGQMVSLMGGTNRRARANRASERRSPCGLSFRLKKKRRRPFCAQSGCWRWVRRICGCI